MPQGDESAITADEIQSACSLVGDAPSEGGKKHTVKPVPRRPSPSTISDRPDGESSRRWFSMRRGVSWAQPKPMRYKERKVGSLR